MDSWLSRQTGRVLLVFENAEAALPEDGGARQVRPAAPPYVGHTHSLHTVCVVPVDRSPCLPLPQVQLKQPCGTLPTMCRISLVVRQLLRFLFGKRQEFLHMLEELQARGVRVLVTSRKAVNSCLGGAAMLRLGALSPAAGQELLITRAGDVADWGHNQALQLVDVCGGNALAITILAGFIHGEYITPEVRKHFEAGNYHCAPLGWCILTV